MKKKLFLLPLLALGALFGMSCSLNNAVVVKAEEISEVTEAAFEEKTYNYVCEEGTITITLKSEHELEFVFAPKEGEAQTTICSYVRVDNNITINLLGNELKIVVNDETMTFIEYVEDKGEEWQEKFNNFKDTYLTPLLGGVSIASVLSAVISIVLAFINRKTNGKIKESNEKTINLSVNVLTAGSKLIEEMQKSKEISENTRKEFKEASDLLIKQIVELSGKTEEMLKLKSCVNQLVLIEQKITAHSKELVASGVAEDIAKLVNDIESIK